MDSPSSLPQCFDCKYGGGEFPCRTPDGRFNFAKVAQAVVERGRSIAAAHRAAGGVARAAEGYVEYCHEWAADCEFDLLQEHPALVLPLMIAEMDACETGEDAAYIAAGIVESAFVRHGPFLIDRVELIAVRSAKFRYFLSGIWSQGGRVDPAVWERIRLVIHESPSMDDDPRTPASIAYAQFHDEAGVRALTSEKIAVIAAELDT